MSSPSFAPSFVDLCTRKYKDQDNLRFAVQDVEQPFQLGDASFDIVVCKMVLLSGGLLTLGLSQTQPVQNAFLDHVPLAFACPQQFIDF